MRRGALLALAALALGSSHACTCKKTPPPAADAGTAAPAASAPVFDADVSAEPGLSAPIAAAYVGEGRVIVAGLDVPTHTLRARAFASGRRVAPEGGAEVPWLREIAWSSDAELRAHKAPGGALFVFRGLVGGARARKAVSLDGDGAPRGEPFDVLTATCVSGSTLLFSDGREIGGRDLAGGRALATRKAPEEKEAALVCSPRAAFALIDEEEGVSSWSLLGDAGAPVPVLRDSEVGADEQRERADYVVDGDLGLVRLGASGEIVTREIRASGLGPLRRLSTRLAKDEDIVAVDAAAGHVVVVSTEDVSARCKASERHASTRVKLLRFERDAPREASFALADGACGVELGPFSTGVTARGVAIGWVERASGQEKGAPPITAFAWVTLGRDGAPSEITRVPLHADAVADAGCDADACWAGVLSRRPGTTVMEAGYAEVLRWGAVP